MENKEKQKSDKKFKVKSLLVILIIALLGFGIYLFINKPLNLGKNLATTSQIDDNSYNQSRIMRVDLNKITSIDFDLGSSDVRIQRSNTNPYIEYTVLYRGEENSYNMEVSFDEGNLKLKSNIIGKELYMKDKIPIVRIFLPMEGGLDEIKGKISAGDVKITDLEVKNFDLEIKSGNITVDNAYFQGSIKNESGSINLNRAELVNTKLETTTGNINIMDSSLGNRLEFITQTGDINVGADKTIDNYKISAKLGVGNFTLGNISYRNIKDGYQSENDGKYNISMTTKIGDINFNKGEGAKLDDEEYVTNDRQTTKDQDLEEENTGLDGQEENN
ncbi:MAG: DUF4097 family beta strand repeat-containing protein [Anaerococcus sp.]|nr:DUF4097 family beta strand repeat-containing protein [Anaerococcus sp.]